MVHIIATYWVKLVLKSSPKRCWVQDKLSHWVEVTGFLPKILMIAFGKLSIGLLRYILIDHQLDRPIVTSADLEQVELSIGKYYSMARLFRLLELIGFCRADIYD